MAREDLPPAGIRPEAPFAARFSISTDWLPERDRLPFYREELSKVLNVDVTPLGERARRHAMSHVSAGPIGLGRLLGSPTRYLRTRSHLNDSDDNFTLVLFESGGGRHRHNGETTEAGKGQAQFFSNALPLTAEFPEGALVTALSVKASALGALVRRPEQAAGRIVSSDLPALALLRGYLQVFEAARDELTPELLQSFGLHVVDLVASIIGATRDGAAQAEAGGIKAARLRAVLSAIATGAVDPRFSIDTVAAQLAVSGRYVNHLLEETRQTFSEHVVEHRLRRAWRLLADPNCRLKVASIAFEAGFNDLSHFNRSFRRRFGETPTSVRGGSKSFEFRGSVRPTALSSELAED